MTIGSHQTTVGKNDNRFTPRWILNRLDQFATDAATASQRPFEIGGERNLTPAENSIEMDWSGFDRTWCNPPFNRYGVGAFVQKMCRHNNGIMLLHWRHDTEWWQPLWDYASGYLCLTGRVIFTYDDGTPCKIENPKAKHYGKVANSGAPVALFSFGTFDADVLAGQPREFGFFTPLIFQRGVLVMPLPSDKSWRATVREWLARQDGPVRVADLYRVFQGHPKAQGAPYWREQIRKVLQLGAGKSIGRDQWVAA